MMLPGKIFVSVTGTQTDLASGVQDEAISLRAEGECQRTKDGFLLQYRSCPGEEIEEEAKLLVSEKEATLSRKGSVSSVFSFVPGQKKESLYETPYGALAFELLTQAISLDETADALFIVIKYTLHTEGVAMSDHVLEITAKLT